jgi:hypothetical protein
MEKMGVRPPSPVTGLRSKKGERRLKKAEDSRDEKRERRSMKEEVRNELMESNVKATKDSERSKKLEKVGGA